MDTPKSAKKGKKRDKKRKHKKRSARAKSPDQSDSSSSSSDDWAEAPTKLAKDPSPSPPQLQQRDDWMDIGDIIPTISAKDYKSQRRAGRIEEQKRNRALSTINKVSM
ncbi:CWF19-like protein 2 [Ixodes scapularis]|uniref:CWF19-like protein 2 n=1 Tax=Ixodes scapularis TaxID=6945 RepID=UPI001A9F8D40|nr:CWF19-like protein 2 [Ixodes scapularis]